LRGEIMTKKRRAEVARRFATIRGDRSYPQFSKSSKVSISLLQRYETGAGLPSVENLILLASNEGVSIDWLLGEM
jgi:transcriptional regulator with XRE-family HTH domain